LCGAAEAVRESLDTPLPPCHRPEFQRCVEHLRFRLGEAGFAATWAAGRAMTLEEAAGEALGS
jgi:hypothetical protein